MGHNLTGNDKKSFQKCCISNALDGTEDYIIFDSDNELGGDEEQCSKDSEKDIYDDILPMN